MKNDLLYMAKAKKAEEKSTCTKVKRGCILYLPDLNMFISGSNGPPSPLARCDPCPRLGCESGTRTDLCRAVHAERQVLLRAANGGYSTDDATLYSYMGVPCKDCLLELIEAGISEIVCIKETYYDKLSKQILAEWISKGGRFRIVEVDLNGTMENNLPRL